MTPGIHSMSTEAYQSASGVSRSMLEWLAPPRTPAHFKAKYIDKLIPDEETPALLMGTLTHRCLLEPDTVTDAFYVKPDGMNYSTKAGKEWRDSHEGRPIITAEQASAINGMRDSVWRHPKASAILKASECERSAFVDDNGLLLKARFDALPRSGNVIADLKTCEDADLDSVEKAMFNYGLFRQAAFYLRVAELLGLKRDYFVFVFVEKSPPYCVACYTPADVILEAGAMMVSRDLQQLRNCYETNRWPGYSEAVEPCSLPKWAMNQIEATQPRS